MTAGALSLAAAAWPGAWLEALWKASWQGGLAVLAIGCACRLLPRMSPAIRCWLWRIAFLKFVVTFLFPNPILVPLLPPANTAIAGVGGPARGAAPVTENPAVTAPVSASPGSSSSSAPVLFAIWTAAAVSLGLGLLRKQQIARHWLRTCQPVEAAAWPAAYREVSQAIGLRMPPRLVASDDGSGPLLLGALRPTIVLPDHFLAADAGADLQSVLAHELAHVKQRDLAWNWLPAIAHILFFFHPLVWVAGREWHLAQEMACDELAVLSTRIGAGAYGEALVSAAARWPTPRFETSAAGIVDSPRSLARRLYAMKFFHSASRRTLVLAFSAIVVAGALVVIPWALSTRPRHISLVSALPTPPGAVLETYGQPVDPASRIKTVFLPANRVNEALAFYEKALVQQGWTVQRATAVANEDKVDVRFDHPQAAPAVLPNGQANYAFKATRPDVGICDVIVWRRAKPHARTVITMSWLPWPRVPRRT